MIRYLPNDMLLDNNSKIMNGIVPMVYLNRFNGDNGTLAKRAKKTWEFIEETDKDLAKRNNSPIFETILEDGLDSNQYADRVAASDAIIELCKKLSEDSLAESDEFNKVLKKLLAITTSKAYFNNKE